MVGMIFVFVGLGVGYTIARLQNEGKLKQAMALFILFLALLLGWLICGIACLFVE